MSPTTDDVLSAALALPDDERAEVVEALISSLQPADRPPLDESWRAVVRRRSDELKAGEVTPIPWADVKRQAREKLDG